MQIEHNGNVLNGVLQDGYWTFYLVTEGNDDLQLLPDSDCEGQTKFTEIQLEYGEERTAFEVPMIEVGDLTGVFKQINDLAFVVLDEETGLSTRLFQIGGAWAVQNLNGNGDIISQINLIEDMMRIQARFIHLNGLSLIDDAIIKNAHIESMTADKLTAGTIDAGEINVVNLSAGNIIGGHAEFLNIAMKALNSRATLDGSRIKIENDANDYIEMNNVPEVRSQDSVGTAVIMGKGRAQFFKDDYQRFYIGSGIENAHKYGTHIQKGQTYGFYRASDAYGGTPAQYHTVKAGESWRSITDKYLGYSVSVYVLANLNGKSPLVYLHPGDTILIKEGTAGNESGIEIVMEMGTSSTGTTRIYSRVYHAFEGGSSLSSDRRIKHDIEPSQVEALGQIDTLAFKQFKWNRDNSHEPLGVIAQDSGILRVEDDEIEGIDLQRSIMLALKGIQELNQEVKELKEEIVRLKGDVNEES